MDRFQSGSVTFSDGEQVAPPATSEFRRKEKTAQGALTHTRPHTRARTHSLTHSPPLSFSKEGEDERRPGSTFLPVKSGGTNRGDQVPSGSIRNQARLFIFCFTFCLGRRGSAVTHNHGPRSTEGTAHWHGHIGGSGESGERRATISARRRATVD